MAAARVAPRLQLLQFNQAYDANTRSNLRRAGNRNFDMLALLRANQREIGRQVPTFRYFNVGGRAHGALPADRFYAYMTNGNRFRDWVAAIVEGRAVTSVDCVDCSRAEFTFSERDLEIVERSLALISPPGAWNSDDPPQRCGPNLDRYSLECVLLTAVYQITGMPPSFQHAGIWEVTYRAIARMGATFEELDREPRQPGSESARPLRLYNSRPGVSAADVISLLVEARDRIRTGMRRKTGQ